MKIPRNKFILSPNILIYFKASKIIGCELVQQADMPFDFDRGFCNTFNEKALMCFDINNARKCRM